MKNLKDQKTISETERQVLERCKAVVKVIDPGAELILYGSRARGDAQSDSDYDLLVVTEKNDTFSYERVIRDALYDIELETGAVLTVFGINKFKLEQPLYKFMPLYQNILREGVVL
jgi:predicted nucleotidyltransferase